MAFEVNFEVMDHYDEPDVLEIRMTTDAPAEIIADGSFIVQWAQFRLTTDKYGEYNKVACTTKVGGTYDDVSINTYFGQAEFRDADVDGSAMADANVNELIPAGYGDIYEKSYWEEDYGSADSDISGNKNVTCVALLKISKMDRDYSMFGQYDVVIGSRVYASDVDTTFASLGEYETQYYLEEPEYDDGNETSPEELSYHEIDYKTWDINVAEDLGFNGRGEQSMYTELVTSPYFYDDDLIRVYMDVELPTVSVPEGTIIFQYVQFKAKEATDNDPVLSVSCQVTVGDWGSQKIENYFGYNKMDLASVQGKSVGEQNLDDVDEYGAFELGDEDYYYDSYDLGNGQTWTTCMVEMSVPKDDTRDESIFTEYIITKGTRLYKSESDTQPIQIGERNSKVNLGEANYDASTFVDQEILDFFEFDDESEMWNEDYVETEIKFQGSQETTIDAATIFGDEDAVAAQNFYSVYESNTIIDMPDSVSFMFEADLPKDKIKDATYIVQLVTLTPASDPSAPALSIGCVVQVGNPEGVKAFMWEGTTDMSFASTGSVAFKDIAASDLVTDSGIEVREDYDFYELKNSTLSFRNKVQNCQAMIPVDKQGADSAIFTTYDA